jgi:hypothetical protein
MPERMEVVLSRVLALALVTQFFKPLEQASFGDIRKNGTGSFPDRSQKLFHSRMYGNEPIILIFGHSIGATSSYVDH